MADDEGPWGSRQPRPPTPPRPSSRADPRRRLAFGLAVAGMAGLGALALARLFPGRIRGSDDWARVAYSLGFLALVSTSLLSRRLKLGQAARYIAIWAAVFGVLALAYAYRGELGEAALRLRSELIPGYAIASGAHELVLAQDADGGFSLIGQVNGQPIRFVVDTGASDIVLDPADARRLGVDPKTLNFARHFETANGVGQGAAYVADSLVVGPIKLVNVPMSINRTPMSASLLGMAFLKRMESFEVKDDRLYLRWRG